MKFEKLWRRIRQAVCKQPYQKIAELTASNDIKSELYRKELKHSQELETRVEKAKETIDALRKDVLKLKDNDSFLDELLHSRVKSGVRTNLFYGTSRMTLGVIFS